MTQDCNSALFCLCIADTLTQMRRTIQYRDKTMERYEYPHTERVLLVSLFHSKKPLLPIDEKKRYPSIAIASFVSQFDSHILVIRISPDGSYVPFSSPIHA